MFCDDNQMEVTKPAKLYPGDTVAVLSPSTGLPSVFPHVYEQGLTNLQNIFDLKVKVMPSTLMDIDTLYRDPRRRADDINAAFADPEVKIIIVTIGGDDSVRILEHLDLDVIRANPKIIMGYSDATTFLTYLNQQGMVTFNGPTIMAGFAQLASLPETFAEHIRTILIQGFDTYTYEPYGVYTQRYLDWNDPANAGKIETPRNDPLGWQWVQGEGRVNGRLFGGCIEVLEFLKGTRYWPTPEFWEGCLLFFETSEEAPPVPLVRRFLRNYGTQGIFDRIRGILFGRARDYTDEQKIALVDMIRDLLTIEFHHPDLPVVANLDFGHTDPQWIMPNGVMAEIDCTAQRIRLLECPTIA